jgi:hypothetical protein
LPSSRDRWGRRQNQSRERRGRRSRSREQGDTRTDEQKENGRKASKFFKHFRNFLAKRELDPQCFFAAAGRQGCPLHRCQDCHGRRSGTKTISSDHLHKFIKEVNDSDISFWALKNSSGCFRDHLSSKWRTIVAKAEKSAK